MSIDVVVVGSLSLDMVFKVPRRPGLGETVKGFSFETFAGGKGNNQAHAASRAGARTAMVGKIGDDSYGKIVRTELEKSSVDITYLTVDKHTGTGLANIYVDPDGDNSIVIVPRANDKLTVSDIDRAMPVLESAKLIMLQLEIPMEVVEHTARLARQLGKKVMLNPAPSPADGDIPQSLYEHIDYFTPNESEAQALLGKRIDSLESAREALMEFRKRLAGTVIITLGSVGVVALDQENNTLFIKAFKVDTVDTTAAGDAFSGALANQLAKGVDLYRAIEVGCAAGALATTVQGAVPSLPYEKEIKALMSLSKEESHH